jgi:hypothetical protein
MSSGASEIHTSFMEEREGHMAHHQQPVDFQIKLAAAVVTAAFVQAPLRFAAYALMLRRSRRAYPQLFDGHAAAAAVAACLDEYQRELAA